MAGNMGQNHRYTVDVAGTEFVIETGRLAEQAGGAVTVTVGETVVFCAATMSKSAREGIDFFPLSVEFEEKLYAAGRIPGSFFRREGRPTEQAILTARIIDRPLRPLFPEGMRNEVQVILTTFSHDQEHHIDMAGIIAASAALTISNIPWNGPIAGVRVGLINGELVVNPTIPQMEDSTLDLRVAVTEHAVNMVECGAEEVDEETMLRALTLAREVAQPIIALQKQMRADVGKEKNEYISAPSNDTIQADVANRVRDDIRRVLAETTDKQGRNEALEVVRETLLGEYAERALVDPALMADMKLVKQYFNDVVAEEVRRRIAEQGIRPDGRTPTQLRDLAAEVDLLPRVHGSGMFKRGQTQVLTITTLGTPRDVQELDGVNPEDSKRYLHHYNFPPFSTGEAYPMRGPKRREIGHGALAEAALRPMIPPEDVFPYTIRLVSEVLSSNGSTSMASVCGSTLSLMDAGVPIKRPVGGIAMGLIKEGDKVVVLTDIQGLEDHIGDMDFKVAGTRQGITALQMDIKITGVSDDVMRQALEQAKVARMQVLDVMLEALPEPRASLKEYAPRMETVKIDPEKIGAIIGPGGKIVRGIQERTGVKIDIEDDGTVFVAGPDGTSVAAALEEILGLTDEPEVGRVYTGKVVRVEPYGAFVQFMPGRDGLVHISQLSDHHIASVEEEVNLGDEIMVMVTDVGHDGKVRLSRQAVLEGWTAEEARSRDRRPPGGDRGGDRGGRGGDRGGRGGYGGGDRGPRR